jgi:hypothetical protein
LERQSVTACWEYISPEEKKLLQVPQGPHADFKARSSSQLDTSPMFRKRKMADLYDCHILVNGIKAGSQVSSCHLEQYRED